MNPQVFVEGLAIRFLLATPIGPIGILCVRDALVCGGRRGFLTGLGGASADVVYAFLAAGGLTVRSAGIQAWQPWIYFGEGLVLLTLGIRMLRTRPPLPTDTTAPRTQTTVLSTFAPALTNPTTLSGYGAEFSTVGLGAITKKRISLSLIAIGVFCGSLLWFTLLMCVSRLFHERMSHGGLAFVSRSLAWRSSSPDLLPSLAGLSGCNGPASPPIQLKKEITNKSRYSTGKEVYCDQTERCSAAPPRPFVLTAFVPPLFRRMLPR